MWKLIICAGLTGWGCGSVSIGEFPTKADCFEALSAVRFDNETPGDNRNSAYAYCKPAEQEKPE